jgi:arylsulfatase A-like enzyme
MTPGTFATEAQAQTQPSGSPSGARSNIVFMMVDNFGYGDLGCYGGGVVRGMPTPRIDKLATEGMRLTNFNVSRNAHRRVPH